MHAAAPVGHAQAICEQFHRRAHSETSSQAKFRLDSEETGRSELCGGVPRELAPAVCGAESERRPRPELQSRHSEHQMIAAARVCALSRGRDPRDVRVRSCAMMSRQFPQAQQSVESARRRGQYYYIVCDSLCYGTIWY